MYRQTISGGEKKRKTIFELTSTRNQREAQRERLCDLSFVFTLLFGCFLCVVLSTFYSLVVVTVQCDFFYHLHSLLLDGSVVYVLY